MIKLTGEQGHVVYISPEHITSIKTTSQGNTGIKSSNDYIIVIESPEEVVRKILDYNISVKQYPIYLAHGHRIKNYEKPKDLVDKIIRMAGLER